MPFDPEADSYHARQPTTLKPLILLFDMPLIPGFHLRSLSVSISSSCPPVTTSEPPQALPLCLKQEMSPEVTSTSPSPNMAASNLAFVDLQALQKPVSVSSSSSSSSCCGNSNHFPNTFNSFSHHAPVYGQFSSQPIMSGNAGVQFIHFHTHICVFHKKLWMMPINMLHLNKVLF